MNGLAVLVCVSLLGVQQTWRTTPEGQLEYVLQVEPTFLASLEQGESVTSKLPSTAKVVHRLCLRISAEDLKKAPLRTPEVPPLATAEERAARSEPDIPVAIIVDAQGRAAETTDVSHGWQAEKDGRVQYVVQLSPDLLGKLREGDEIYTNLYPEAGQIEQFIIVSGQSELPRKSAKAPSNATLATRDRRTVAPVAAENPAAYGPVADDNPAPGARLHGPRTAESRASAPKGAALKASESKASAGRAAEPPRLRNPQKFSVGDGGAEQPVEKSVEQPAEQPLYGAQEPEYAPGEENREAAAAPELFPANPMEEVGSTEQPDTTPIYGPGSSPAFKRPARSGSPRAVAAEAPVSERGQFDKKPFDKGQFANAPVNKPKTTPASLAPEKDGNEYLSESETRHSKPRSSFGAADGNVAATTAEEDQSGFDNSRIASVETPKRRTSLSAGTAKSSSKSAPAATAASEEPKPWWPLFFTCCALFLSVGGNLYLGWTAAEFYSRYRLAIERMRSGGRETEED